ncbi:hypothetical protein [Liquorilactobacillus mali]|uniref:hypothetical protein n=1 Tax=Liquorilactobacillus mali TaxID=1618 RepID=UPI002955DB9D|nr:hypothetical protein [Liquorilactobacillus mali]MDV7757966.1 hypothetical protein [Liquorilactobacillus mali]
MLIGLTVYNVYQQNTVDGIVLTDHVKQSSSSVSSTSIVNSSSETNSQASSQDSSTIQAPVVISDYSRYNNYSGNYKGSESYSLDFKKSTLTSTGAAKQQLFYFDKTILHPDNSLVINVHSNYHYNAYDAKGAQ